MRCQRDGADRAPDLSGQRAQADQMVSKIWEVCRNPGLEAEPLSQWLYSGLQSADLRIRQPGGER
jgi:hypothetical protein